MRNRINAACTQQQMSSTNTSSMQIDLNLFTSLQFNINTNKNQGSGQCRLICKHMGRFAVESVRRRGHFGELAQPETNCLAQTAIHANLAITCATHEMTKRKLANQACRFLKRPRFGVLSPVNFCPAKPSQTCQPAKLVDI